MWRGVKLTWSKTGKNQWESQYRNLRLISSGVGAYGYKCKAYEQNNGKRICGTEELFSLKEVEDQIIEEIDYCLDKRMR